MEGGHAKSDGKRRQRFIDALAAGVASLKAGRVVGKTEMRGRIDRAIAARAGRKKKARTS